MMRVCEYEHLTVMTQHEVAAELGVSRARVAWLEQRAMRKLRLLVGQRLLALLVAMQEQEPIELGGRQMRRGL